MGLFRALRPLLFSLPPEAGHRLALGALSLPLPWERVGGAVDDPRLRVRVAGLELRNPLGLAAGFDKGCRHLDALGRLGFGYVVGGSLTRLPRRGNPRPRVVRHRDSLVNAMGLPNPGAAAAAERLLSQRPTVCRWVSLADEDLAEVLAAHRMVEPLVDAVELNASCPNVPWGRDRDAEAHLRLLLRELTRRRTRPVFVKLPPFRTAAEREAVLALAGVAQEEGADGLTCSNTRPVAEPRLAAGAGGLSGRALSADTPRIVEEVRRATGGTLPIHACGGIFTPEDALACLDAGASTLQLYTGLVFEGPRVVERILRGVLGGLEARGRPPAGFAGSA